MTRRVAITGATGLVGAALCRHLAAAGWTVNALARRSDAAPRAPGITPFSCDLPSTLDPASLSGCAAVIHAAYATRPSDLRHAARTNEEGTRRLLAAARAAGVPRFIFISSTAAHPQARSYYGQSKLRLEGLLDAAHDLSIRPGLVLARDLGLFARLVHAVRTRRLLPLPGGGRQPLQTVHIDDLCRAISVALDRGIVGTLTVAAPASITLRDLLALVAIRSSRRVTFIPVPSTPVLLALRMAEACRIPLPVSSENLLGLLGLRTADTRPDLERLGLEIRDTPRSLDDLL